MRLYRSQALKLLLVLGAFYLILSVYFFLPVYLPDPSFEASIREEAKAQYQGKSDDIVISANPLVTASVHVYGGESAGKSYVETSEFRLQINYRRLLVLSSIFIIGFIGFSLFWPTRPLMDEELNIQHLDIVLANIAAGFRYRAYHLRRSAKVTLVLVVAALIVGIAIFLSAGLIARQETLSLSPILSDMKRNQELFGRLLNDFSPLIKNYLQERNKGSKSLTKGEPKFRPPDIRGESLHRGSLDFYLQELIDMSEKSYGGGGPQSELNRLAKLQETLDEKSTTTYIISSLTTRIGSVLILLFLVQILVNLYRYDIRLAGYYDARADALTLIGKNDEKALRQMVSIFSPEALEFGRVPRSPTENALKLAQDLVSSTKEK